MRLALTKYGWPQVVTFPAIVLGVMIVCLVVGVLYLSAWAIISIESVLAIILIWVLSFFRDPYRTLSTDKNVLLAPADGRITDVEIVGGDPTLQYVAKWEPEGNGFIDGPALRIGIFLNIFDVHVNRAPCNVKVERISYKKGKHKNAMSPESGRVNESNDLCIIRTNSPKDRLIVRQISGAIARRIVCAIREGQELTGGEKFGMIKFGSRTELYVPLGPRLAGTPLTPNAENGIWEPKRLIQVGDRVKAGLTPLVRYESHPSEGLGNQL